MQPQRAGSLEINNPTGHFTVQPTSDTGRVGFQIGSQLRHGEMPHNEQLKQLAESARGTIQHQVEYARAEPVETQQGETILWDTDTLLKDMEILLDRKNNDEQMQRIAVLARDAAVEVKETIAPPARQARFRFRERATREPVKQATMDLGAAIRGFGKDMLLDSDFRDMLSNSLSLTRELFMGERVSEASTSGGTTGTGAAGSGVSAGAGVAGVTGGVALTEGVHGGSSGMAGVTGGPGSTASSYHPAPGTVSRGTTVTAAGTGAAVSSAAVGAVTTSPTSSSKLTREQWVDSFVELLNRLSQHRDWNQANSSMHVLFEHFRRVMRPLLADTSSVGGGSNFRRRYPRNYALWQEVRLFVERIANYSLAGFEEAWTGSVDMMRSENQVGSFVRDFWRFFDQQLLNPAATNTEAQKQQLGQFWERAVQLRESSRWDNTFRKVFNEMKSILDGIKNDPDIRQLNEDVRKLGRDIMYDQQGKLSTEKLRTALEQLRVILLPSIMAELKYMRLPAIEGETSDGKYWFFVHDAFLQATDLLPKKVYWSVDSHGEFLLSGLASASSSRAALEIRDLDARLLNCQFEYRKLRGIKLHDIGRLNMAMSGIGIRAGIRINDQRALMPKLSVETADAFVQNAHVEIIQARHRFLDKLGAKIALGRIKRNVEHTLSERLYQQLDSIVQLINRAIRANTPTTGLHQRVDKVLGGAKQLEHKGVQRRSLDLPPEVVRYEAH